MTFDELLKKHRVTVRMHDEVGPGWFPLLARTFRALTKAGWDRQAAQIKEKMGGLRLYLENGDDRLWGIVQQAENDSVSICEICGKPGERHGGSWIATRCKRCFEAKWG